MAIQALPSNTIIIKGLLGYSIITLLNGPTDRNVIDAHSYKQISR